MWKREMPIMPLKTNSEGKMRLNTKNPYENISTEELPEILIAKHISGHLHLSLRCVY